MFIEDEGSPFTEFRKESEVSGVSGGEATREREEGAETGDSCEAEGEGDILPLKDEGDRFLPISEGGAFLIGRDPSDGARR